MSREETLVIFDKIHTGVQLAITRLIHNAKSNNRELVISKDGNVIRVKPKHLNEK